MNTLGFSSQLKNFFPYASLFVLRFFKISLMSSYGASDTIQNIGFFLVCFTICFTMVFF